jgi:DNA-binding IclR family transcriptional regulator
MLELLSGLQAAVGVNELSRRLGIPKSSASMLVATLQDRGYVMATPEGILLAEEHRGAGWVGGRVAHLRRHARPVMQRLSRETGESCFLGVATRSFDIQYVDKAVSESALRYDADLALVRPAYCTSIGWVMLASLNPEQLERYFAGRTLSRLTPRTVTDEDAIRASVAETRRRGFATISDSHVLGTSGVAAPVHRQGRVVAGLAVIAPSERFSLKADANIANTVAAADELSQALAR